MSTGIWLVGARGSVATTTIVGCIAANERLAPAHGCVAEQLDFANVALPPMGSLVFGGHDVSDVPLRKKAEALGRAGVFRSELVDYVARDLDEVDARIVAGYTKHAPQRSALAGISADLTNFRDTSGVDRVVVVNVSSTEAPLQRPIDDLDAALDDDALPPSSLYALAAFESGCSFVDFTPSTGARIPALDALARRSNVPYAGSDGKTGETLVKSVLAPMFARRALPVRAWSGTNLLGGGDGETLSDPTCASSKVTSKALVLDRILGSNPEGDVHIDNVPALGDWKTAWDHILFDGFLGTRMSLQFTWQGCDSALAAPLVLDLARFTAFAHSRGESGALSALAFYFKDPVDTTDHALSSQYDTLVRWANAE